MSILTENKQFESGSWQQTPGGTMISAVVFATIQEVRIIPRKWSGIRPDYERVLEIVKGPKSPIMFINEKGEGRLAEKAKTGLGWRYSFISKKVWNMPNPFEMRHSDLLSWYESACMETLHGIQGVNGKGSSGSV